MTMDAGRENGNGNGELGRQAERDWSVAPVNQPRGGLGSPPGLGRRLAGGVVSGPRQRAAIAAAERDAARAEYAAQGSYGRAAPPTVRIRGEFSEEQAHWVICYLWEHRPMWVGAKLAAPNGKYYVELTHFQWPRVGVRIYVHDRNEFWTLLTGHDYDDLPVHHTAPPLGPGHRR